MKISQWVAAIVAGATMVSLLAPGTTRAEEPTIPKVSLDDPLAPFLESRAVAKTAEGTERVYPIRALLFA